MLERQLFACSLAASWVSSAIICRISSVSLSTRHPLTTNFAYCFSVGHTSQIYTRSSFVFPINCPSSPLKSPSTHRSAIRSSENVNRAQPNDVALRLESPFYRARSKAFARSAQFVFSVGSSAETSASFPETVSLWSEPRYGTEPVVDGKYEVPIAVIRGDRQDEDCTGDYSSSVADSIRQSVIDQDGS